MKRFLFAALAALTLLFLAGCASKPVEPETAEYYLTDEDVPLTSVRFRAPYRTF